MGKLVFGMMQSLDGYVAGPSGGPQPDGILSAEAAAELPPPGETLFRHFEDHVARLSGMLYGRRMYEVMRYWDEEHPEWEKMEKDFAQAWRPKPKWVASRTLKSVGKNATLIEGDLIQFAKKLKQEQDGEIDVAGPELAHALSIAGLIDEYRLYYTPYVLGGGKPFFAGRLPPLRLANVEKIDNAVRLTYVPA